MTTKENTMLENYAAFSAQRMEEARRAAGHRRMASSMQAQRRWHWLEQLAARRAHRARERADRAQAAYSLAA
ncbi:MAG: hypothetical protein ACR2KJ_06505 [Jatrophihabitans sp.]